MPDPILCGNLFNLQNNPMRKIYFTFYRLRQREFKLHFHIQEGT